MSSPIRLLQTAVFHSQYIGGLERTLLYLLDRLPKDRFSVTVALATGMEDSSFGLAVKKTGSQVLTLPDVLAKLDVKGMYKTVQQIQELDPHLVHIHMTHSVANPFLPFAVRLAGVPFLVATEQTNTIIPQKPFGRVRKYLTGRLIDKTVAVSDAVREGLIHHYKFAADRIEVIANAVDVHALHSSPPPSVLSDVRESLHVPPNAYIIGTVAAMRDQKGYEYLIRAIPKIVNQLPNAYFVFVGDGVLRQDLERLVDMLNVREHVRFLGWQFNTAPLLHTFDLFVLPSLYEGLPLAVLEAMAVELPIVATEVDGTAEAVTSSRNGVLIPPADVEALVSSIMAVADNQESALLLGKQAYADVLARYDVSVMVSKYLALYQELISQNTDKVRFARGV